jgi:hypothetical protein
LFAHSCATAATPTTLHKALFALLGPVALPGVLIVGLGDILMRPVALALVADLLDPARLRATLLLVG